MGDVQISDRVVVSAGVRDLGVTVTMGETVVTIRAPSSMGLMSSSEAQAHALALRTAARALEVAAQEIAQEQARAD